MKGSRLQKINGAFLLVSFFLCRIVFGTRILYASIGKLFRSKSTPEELHVRADEVGSGLVWFYTVAGGILGSMNWVWFYAMINSVTSRFKKRKTQ